MQAIFDRGRGAKAPYRRIDRSIAPTRTEGLNMRGIFASDRALPESP